MANQPSPMDWEPTTTKPHTPPKRQAVGHGSFIKKKDRQFATSSDRWWWPAEVEPFTPWLWGNNSTQKRESAARHPRVAMPAASVMLEGMLFLFVYVRRSVLQVASEELGPMKGRALWPSHPLPHTCSHVIFWKGASCCRGQPSLAGCMEQ